MAQLRLLTLAAAGILALAGTASAGSVNSLLDYDGQYVSAINNDLNVFDDDNFEYHVDTNSNGFLDVGEVIRGSITMNILKADGLQFTLGGTPDANNDQFSGVFSLQVRALLDDGDGNASTMDIVFEPDPGFAAWVAGLDTDPATGGQQAASGPAILAGTIARMWTNPTRTWQTSNSLSADANIGTFAVGDFYFDIGFADPSAASHDDGLGNIVSDNGEGWVARGGGVDIETANDQSDTSEIGTGLFVVSVLLRGDAPKIIPHPLDGAHIVDLGASFGDVGDIQGTSNVNGPGTLAQAGFDLSSDTQFAFLAVPLPTAVWPGIAMLLGLGAFRIRRRKLMTA